jgi:hypothetical protein
MAGFSAEALDLSADRWEDIERYNSCLARLVDRRKPAVVVEGPLVNRRLPGARGGARGALLGAACRRGDGRLKAAVRPSHCATVAHSVPPFRPKESVLWGLSGCGYEFRVGIRHRLGCRRPQERANLALSASLRQNGAGDCANRREGGEGRASH